MGVSVSHPLRRTGKMKYIQTVDGESSAFDETEQFLRQSSHQENSKGESSQDSKGSSKRNEPGLFQFKAGRGNSKCGAFDSLDTIATNDSRKSAPFAVLPENNTHTSTSSRDSDEGFSSIQSDGKAKRAEKNVKVLFTDEVEDVLEDGTSAQKYTGKLKEKNTPKAVQQKAIAPLKGKLGRKGRVCCRCTTSGEDDHFHNSNRGNRMHEKCADGRETERESELEMTRLIRADSETEMVQPSNKHKSGSGHSTYEKFS